MSTFKKTRSPWSPADAHSPFPPCPERGCGIHNLLRVSSPCPEALRHSASRSALGRAHVTCTTSTIPPWPEAPCPARQLVERRRSLFTDPFQQLLLWFHLDASTRCSVIFGIGTSTVCSSIRFTRTCGKNFTTSTNSSVILCNGHSFCRNQYDLDCMLHDPLSHSFL